MIHGWIEEDGESVLICLLMSAFGHKWTEQLINFYPSAGKYNDTATRIKITMAASN